MRYLSLTTAVLATVLVAGCARPEPTRQPREPAAPPSLRIIEDLARARQEAAASGKPLLVLSVLGDYQRHC